ncbi:C40 family peptidase [soil metagenome]
MEAMLARTLSFALIAVAIPSAHAEIIAQLGQSIRPSIIRKSPNSRAGIWYKPKAYQYVLVASQEGNGWNKVVMSNGADGFIRTEDVALLPQRYRVTRGAPTRSTGREVGNLTSRSGAARAGLNYVGVPYKWGGNDLLNGIDCSGFVKKLYGAIGIELPRTAAEQAQVGMKIDNFQDLQAGDRLYFWDGKKGKIGHTGLYLGNGFFVHSSSGHHGVNTDPLNARWQKLLVAARR